MAGRFLSCLRRRRPGGWLGAAAACLCAAAVVLAGSGGGQAVPQAQAGQQAQTGAVQLTGLSQAASGPWQAENSDTRHRLYDVACLSALWCEAVGAAGTIVFTADGGRIWRQQANPLRGSSTALYQITCVAPSTCYVIGRPDTNNWTQVGPDWTRSVLNDITCPTTLTCYLAGTHGSIARITNGTTLAAQRPPTARNLYGIACTGPSTCYAVGDGGTLLALR